MTILNICLGVKIASEQNDLKQVQKLDLHNRIFALNSFAETDQNLLRHYMCDASSLFVLDSLYQQL